MVEMDFQGFMDKFDRGGYYDTIITQDFRMSLDGGMRNSQWN